MTQADKVQKYLERKRTITAVTAVGVLGITRLAAVIHRLNKSLPKSRRIKSRLVQGMQGRYAEYYV